MQNGSEVLSPVRADIPAEHAVDDRSWTQAVLDAVAAMARARSRLGMLPGPAAEKITHAARAERLRPADPVTPVASALTHAVAGDADAVTFVRCVLPSQPVLDIAAMLTTAKAIRLIRSDLDRARVALATLPNQAPRPTPSAVAHKAEGWQHLILDADDRLAGTLNHGLRVTPDATVVPVEPDRPPDPEHGTYTAAGYLDYDVLQGDSRPTPLRLAAVLAEETGLAAPRSSLLPAPVRLAEAATVLTFVAGALGALAADVWSLPRDHSRDETRRALATMARSAANSVPVMATALIQSLISNRHGKPDTWPLLRECLRLTGNVANTTADLATAMLSGDRTRR